MFFGCHGNPYIANVAMTPMSVQCVPSPFSEITTYLFVLLRHVSSSRQSAGRTWDYIVTDADWPEQRRYCGSSATWRLCYLKTIFADPMVMNVRILGQVTAGMQWRAGFRIFPIFIGHSLLRYGLSIY
ncbi:MAG: hypothetical protein ACLTLQ_08735 [[Clostridium] scindens]